MIENYFPWLLSAISIYMTFHLGNKHPKAWLIGIFNQVLWLIWIIASESWGFLPLNIALWVMYVRNHFKWQIKDK